MDHKKKVLRVIDPEDLQLLDAAHGKIPDQALDLQLGDHWTGVSFRFFVWFQNLGLFPNVDFIST